MKSTLADALVVAIELGDPSGCTSFISVPQSPPQVLAPDNDQDSSETQYVRLDSHLSRLSPPSVRLSSAPDDDDQHSQHEQPGSYVSLRLAKRAAIVHETRALSKRLADGEPKDSLIWTATKGLSKYILVKIPGFVKTPDDVYKPFLAERWHGRSYALPFDDSLARRRTFDRPWAVLPNQVADMPCQYMTPSQLLDILNSIFKTQFSLVDSLQAILSKFIDNGSDLGQAYGHLRADWGKCPDFEMMQSWMLRRQEIYDKKRESAIVDNVITNVSVSPRRIWDLYANRVLPSYIRRDSYGHSRSSDIQAVSHSWQPPSNRHAVLTNINGKAWRVPIPEDTTLDEIRGQLLTLGAEYVWLDVLCLRQFDERRVDAEDARKKEWRLDIPTIGSVYHSTTLPVIIYFNGLGRPFCDGVVDPDDEYHWLNRIWTLQELRRRLLIGGLRQHPSDAINLDFPSTWPSQISHSFLTALNSQPRLHALRIKFKDLCAAVRRRAYSNAVDQVACLSYFLLEKIPSYDPDLSPEVAWEMVIENMDSEKRTCLLFSDFGPRTQPSSWRPTWEEFMNCTSDINDELQSHIGRLGPLQFLKEPSLPVGDERKHGVYYQHAYVAKGFCMHMLHDGKAFGTFKSPIAGPDIFFWVEKCGESVEQDKEYTIIGMKWKYWIVCEEVGVQVINGRRALEVAKVSAMTGRFRDIGDRRKVGDDTLVVYH